MRKKFMFQVVHLPLSLGETMTSALAQQAQVYGLSNLPPSKLARLLFDASDLSCFELRVLESQRRFYPGRQVKRTVASLRRWAERRVFRLDDDRARQVIAEQLGIDDLDELAELMLALNAHDAELVTLLLSGRLGEAIRRVPNAGYGSRDDDDHLLYVEVMDLINMVVRLWIANDLQMEAAAAHVRLFRPTGCEVMDGEFNGKAPVQGSVAIRLQPEVDLLEEAVRLFFDALRKPIPKTFAAVEPVHNRARICALGATYAFAWPARELRPFRRDATEAEAAMFRAPGLNLEQRARIMLVYWRAEHGDNLEAWLEFRLRQARRVVGELRSELDGIRKDSSRRGARVHALKGAHPLIRLWLACERAVAWTGPQDSGEDAVDRTASKTINDAIQAARSCRSVTEPRIAKHNVRRAQELFFALRCTIVRDPGHLPEGLLEVTLETGQSELAKTREHAEQLRGRPFGFDEIDAYQRSRIKTVRNGEEVYSHRYTTPTNDFMKAHRREPSDDSKKIVEHAWGTIAWRLG